MKNKCDCYRIESKRQYTYHPITGEPIRHDITVGVCWGTKEMDECHCDGDRTKCDFYPEVRAKAKKVVTNGGHIRSMDNKELAEFLMSNWFVDCVCKNCEGEYDKCGDMKFCQSKIYKWLLKTKE